MKENTENKEKLFLESYTKNAIALMRICQNQEKEEVFKNLLLVIPAMDSDTRLDTLLSLKEIMAPHSLAEIVRNSPLSELEKIFVVLLFTSKENTESLLEDGEHILNGESFEDEDGNTYSLYDIMKQDSKEDAEGLKTVIQERETVLIVAVAGFQKEIDAFVMGRYSPKELKECIRLMEENLHIFDAWHNDVQAAWNSIEEAIE